MLVALLVLVGSEETFVILGPQRERDGLWFLENGMVIDHLERHMEVGFGC